MKITDNETRWAKIGQIKSLTFIGKEAIVFGASCHLIFVNLQSGEELLYTANNKKVGDGISCFAGHRSQNVFAFAEKRTNPTLFIKTYPNFEEVRTFKDVEPRGYVALAFSETSLFLTLGDIPDFTLTVWNWRKGEKLANQKTTIHMQKQILTSNLCSPVILTQLVVGTTKIHIWDIFVCGKKTALTQHVVKTPKTCNPFTAVLWTTENTLFVLDTAGCVYMMVAGHLLEKVIDFGEEGDIPTSFAWYKSGLAILGPTNEIRHYKKSGSWTMDWSVAGTEPLGKIFARMDHMVALTKKFDLLELLPPQNTFKTIKTNESEFNDFCLIYPTGEYLMALCHRNTLNLYKVDTGEWTSTLTIEGHGLTLTENPRFPYAAVGLECGKVVLISAYKQDNLVKMTEFHLIREPINSIYFNECGTVFAAANLNAGLFFIIEGIPGGQMEIVTVVDAKRQIANYMMILSENCYRIFCIPVTSEKYIAGNKIIRFCYIKEKGLNVKVYQLENKNTLYLRLCPISGNERDRKFYAIPYAGKTMKEIEIKKGDTRAKVVGSIKTGHQMREIYLRRDKKVLTTWACDGFVVVRSADLGKNIALALPHHRMMGGVKKAWVDPHTKYIISLGRGKVLVCTNVMENEIDVQLKQELEEVLNSANYRLMFTKRTIGYIPKGIYEGKCYTEIQEIQRIEKERIACQKEREAILKEFESIQEILQKLIDENLAGPENEKLDFTEFNLNKKLYEVKRNKHQKLQKATEVYLKELIEAQNRVSNFIMKFFWEIALVQEKAIRAIFNNFEVKNYPLLPPDVVNNAALVRTMYQRNIEQFLNELNSFSPWNPIPEDQLKEWLSSRPSLPEKSETPVVSLFNLEEKFTEASEKEDEALLETQIAFSGSDIARFIETQNSHYQQMELMTFFQTELQWRITKSDTYKLKELFNSQFENVMTSKTKEMSHIKERNDRLRHIVSEINYFSEDKISVRIEDPEWKQVENPELIAQVKNEEVPITPYISPSEQARLDAQAAEEERLRLLLLADDFRERALMAMMNGVLEVRWEDELKKDVPLPKCMIEKEPENYNEDDLRMVRDYEEKVQFLNSERERYKNMLTAEYKKLSNNVRDQIRKFNEKLNDLLYYKLLLDAAISQETLKIARTKLFQFQRRDLINKEKEWLKRIKDNEHTVRSLHHLITSLHDSVAECKLNVDSFQFKDRVLEKGFKKDFQDMSLVVQEQASKLYKKRPKINFRSVNSATLLNELSKCIMSNAKPPPALNADCVEFLKGLDQLDQYVGVPSVVDEHTYALICKHRRLRIEYEIKSRAAQFELTEAETTLTAFNRRLAQKKEGGVKLAQELAHHRTNLLNAVRNREIQFVIQRGLAEIPLTGEIEDFQDAVLVCRNDVENINRIILEFGKKKIHSLQQGMTFRRKILAQEWEHKRMKMLIQDLGEKLVDINGVRLTKEIQIFLKSKNKDRALPFETEVDMIKASYENTIQDRKDKVKRMRKQIKSIQAHVKEVDEKIQTLNVDVCEMNMVRDKELDNKERAMIDARMQTLLKRSDLVQQVQNNHHEILVLQTELELLRLKTYPTLKYKVCN